MSSEEWEGRGNTATLTNSPCKKMSSKQFLQPDITFSDDEDDDASLSARKISNQIKKTQTNQDAIKHPNTFYVEDDEDPQEDSEVIFSEEDESYSKAQEQSSERKRKTTKKTADKNSSKRRRRIESDDEDFLPEDEIDSEDNDEIESVASDEMSDERISDSDYDPDAEDCDDDGQNNQFFGIPEDGADETINLSSDNESPDKDTTRVIHSDSREFWNKVEELKTKGFSIQQAGALTNSGEFELII